jgi:hypothetical protein
MFLTHNRATERPQMVDFSIIFPVQFLIIIYIFCPQAPKKELNLQTRPRENRRFLWCRFDSGVSFRGISIAASEPKKATAK